MQYYTIAGSFRTVSSICHSFHSRTRMSIFIVPFERWGLISFRCWRDEREYLNLLSRNMFMPAIRFSRSRVARLSVGGDILDWQQIRGVKRIAWKGRGERRALCRGSLFKDARLIDRWTPRIAKTYFSLWLQSWHSPLPYSPYLLTNIATIYISCNETSGTVRQTKIMQYIFSTRLHSCPQYLKVTILWESDVQTQSYWIAKWISFTGRYARVRFCN